MDGRRIILIAFFALSVQSCFARGWTTNAWPSTNYYRAGKIMAQECYTALVERCSVVDISNPTAPSWYRSQRTNLKNIKSKIQDITELRSAEGIPSLPRPFYVDHTATNGSGKIVFTNDVPPFMTETALLSSLQLPTNFLDYTPYRCLNGVGPFTNDPSYGAPHGYTNSETAKGGTNFPAGRSTWYTTDYGWQGAKNAIDHLKWTAERARIGTDTNLFAYQNIVPGSYSDTNWPTVLATASNAYIAASNWITSEFTSSLYNSRAISVFPPGSTYQISFSFNSRGDTFTTNIPTNYAQSSELYTSWRKIIGGAGASYYDFYGFAPNEDEWYSTFTIAESTTNTAVWPMNTNINVTSLFDAGSPPVSYTAYSQRQKNFDISGGASSYSGWWILKWNGPNGFDYLE